MLIYNGKKLCKKCGNEKPLSDFRARKKKDKLSYGNCLLCEHIYDHQRRRAKGLMVIIFKSLDTTRPHKSTISRNDRVRIRNMVNRPDSKKPIHPHQCKEC